MTKPYRTVYTVPVFRRKKGLVGWSWEAVDANKVVAYGRKTFKDINEAQKAGEKALKRRGLK